MRALPVTESFNTKHEAFALLDELKAARKLYHLEEVDINYLRGAIASVRVEDLQNGRLCGFWDKASKLVTKFGISERRLRRSEERLERLGFIQRTSFSNGRRNGKRTDGKIVSLFGIDLSPFLNRKSEVEQVARSVKVNDDIREDL